MKLFGYIDSLILALLFMLLSIMNFGFVYPNIIIGYIWGFCSLVYLAGAWVLLQCQMRNLDK